MTCMTCVTSASIGRRDGGCEGRPWLHYLLILLGFLSFVFQQSNGNVKCV
jgi:hypothetical protein